jgi:taurine dioxygenase
MLDIRPLGGSFGAEIRGADLGAASRAQMRQLADGLYRHRVICIRGQRLDEGQYLAFGRQWGAPIPHVLDHMRMPGYPELMTVGNTEKRDEDPKIRNGAALWHTDQSYEAVPASATMLYSIRAPEHGGETQFCDMATAYDDLATDTRAAIADLEVAHKYGRGKRRADEPPVNPIINDAQDARVPPVYHPLVLAHPVTGRRSLYALGHGACGIKGMPDGEAEALLEGLREHAVQEKYLYRHHYAVGDVVVWDTLQTMHRATPIDVATGPGDARLLWRISVRGRPEVLETAA